MQKFQMYIGGKWVDAASGKTYRAINPATEEEVAEIPLGGKEDVDKAVAAAKQAFPLWSGIPQMERSRILMQLAELQRQNADELTKWEILDHGTPINLARMQSMFSSGNIEYCAEAARALMGSAPPPSPGGLTCVQREPIGVAAIIIPWNSPILMLTSKMGACLATGNTCVVKPSAIDSLVTLKYAEIISKLDIPPGTINVVTGPGGTVGNALATHPDIGFISFTGSSDTGKAIMAAGSSTLKRMQMELGGKNPFIVLEDADIDKIIPMAAGSICHNTGMVCASPGRFYIHEKIHDEFVEKFIKALQKVVVGDPNDEKTEMGPVVSAEHRDRVEEYIRKGIEEGAKLLLGGKRPTQPPLDKGYYILPAVFTDVKPGTTLFREEVFGPVACFMKFSTDEEALASANDNVYGLTASVYSRDTGRAYKIASRINAGVVGVNGSRAMMAETPWGGFKESGFGKENSMYGLEEYTQLRVISIGFDDGREGPMRRRGFGAPKNS
jgi:acyl-CoA reductase-like NAD-dependent aldehyde dehydrogenase